MRKLLCAIALMLSGCATGYQEPRMVFHSDVSFTKDERACIEAGAAVWEDAFGWEGSIGFKWDYDTKDPVSVAKHELLTHRLVRWTSDMDIVKEKDLEACRRAKWADCSDYKLYGQASGDVYSEFPAEVRIIVDRVMPAGVCQQTATHEFGHAFGLDHTGNSRDIMWPSITGAKCLSDNDIAEFCRHNTCGPNPPKGCK